MSELTELKKLINEDLLAVIEERDALRADNVRLREACKGVLDYYHGVREDWNMVCKEVDAALRETEASDE